MRDNQAQDAQDGEELVPLTIRLPRRQHAELRAAAFAARVPLARYARALLAGNELPAAPPPMAALPTEAAQLIEQLRGVLGNIAQLTKAAEQAGDPLARLAGLSTRAQSLSRAARAGQVAAIACADFTATLRGPAATLNDLARASNSGQLPAPPAWAPVLRGLDAALRGTGTSA